MFKKHWLSILLAFVIPVVGVFWWWGGFAGVTISEAERGPYRYVYLDHQGELSKLPQTQDKVRQAMREQGLTLGRSITVLLDDPRHTERKKLRAHTGYLIGDSVKVAPPLLVGDIPVRPVWVAEVRAAALLGPSKAYQALHEHLKARNAEIRMPTVEIYEGAEEIYQMGLLTVEMER